VTDRASRTTRKCTRCGQLRRGALGLHTCSVTRAVAGVVAGDDAIASSPSSAPPAPAPRPDPALLEYILRYTRTDGPQDARTALAAEVRALQAELRYQAAILAAVQAVVRAKCGTDYASELDTPRYTLRELCLALVPPSATEPAPEPQPPTESPST
jgi:hypothetical protein